jgi:endonuclease G, mitochondrial
MASSNVLGEEAVVHTSIATNLPASLPEVQVSKPLVALLARKGYVLAHSGEQKIPLWVAEKVTPYLLDGSPLSSLLRRIFERRWFDPDPLLSGTERASREDYRSGRWKYHRGHLAAVGNVLHEDEQDMRRDTYYLSNMAPMIKKFNRGIWVELEREVRNWVSLLKDSLWVISGTYVEPGAEVERIGDGRVVVPTHYWKIIAQKVGDRHFEVTSFMIPHQRRGLEDLDHYVTTLHEIERRVGWKFFQTGATTERRLAAWP